jgi:predicted AAA+ superfamily ATPase
LADRRPFSDLDLSVLNRLFVDFCILGGMPEVVRNYLERQSFEGSLSLQRQIVAAYRDDVRKYAEGMDQTRILNVLDHIPVQLARENKKFQVSKVARDARFKDYRGCVEWLHDAGIVTPCYAMQFPELPIRGNYDETRFKLYMADTGLLVSMLDDETQMDIRANGNLGGYKGGIYENIVGESLTKSGADLVYFRREDSTLEEDFFLRTAKSLVPVEVKATNGRSKSLRTLIASDHYPDISWGVKLVLGNIGYENDILTLPYATVFLLKRLLASI